MSVGAQPYTAYQRNQVMTVSQSKLVLLLYDGVIRFLTQAEEACVAKDISLCHNYLLRAQEVLVELQLALNRDAGGQVAEGLYMLYDYMYRRLVEANTQKDRQLMTEVRGLINDLREAWQQITTI